MTQLMQNYFYLKRTSRAAFIKRWAQVIGLCLLGLMLFPGCDDDEKDKSSKDEFKIEKTYKRGAVTFTLKLSRTEITIAERLRLVLEASAQEDYEVELPGLGEKLGQFKVVEHSISSPKLGKGGVVVFSKSCELEPFLSGQYLIPAMKATFWKKGEEKKYEVESEELEVLVKSLLPEGAELAIREIAPPGELPALLKAWLYLLIISAIIIGILALIFMRRRKILAEEITKKTAQEIAYEDLEALLARELISKGEVKLFYLCLSNILRHYIENQFSIHAPERTTEEFLTELRSNSTLNFKHKSLLKEFLQHCDLVKFAKHSPTDGEIQKALGTSKQFIYETGLDNEEEVVVPADRSQQLEHL